MGEHRPKRIYLFAGLFISVVVLAILGLYLGSVSVPRAEILRILTGQPADNPALGTIIKEIRLPRTLAALSIGSALSAAGLLMQALFRNPLAGPYVLGVSGGASLGVAILLLSGGAGMLLMTPWSQIIAATTGALALLLLILIFSRMIRDNVSLLITGMMLGSMAGALVGILQYFGKPGALKNFILWTFGDMGGIAPAHLRLLIPVIFLALVLSLTMIKSLDASLLGETAAESVGFHPGKFRFRILVLTTLLAGTATAFSGPVAFIGLIVPHIVRRIFKTPRHAVLLPATMLAGGGILLFCDLIARLPGYALSLPLNAVTALVGSPVIISILLSVKKYR